MDAILLAALKAALANPEALMMGLDALMTCQGHTRHDLAQDALDAAAHGHITDQEAAQVIQLLLSKPARQRERQKQIEDSWVAAMPSHPMTLLLNNLGIE